MRFQYVVPHGAGARLPVVTSSDFSESRPSPRQDEVRIVVKSPPQLGETTSWFDVASPGTVFYKEHADGEEQHLKLLVREDNLPTSAPNPIQTPGLDMSKQQYLYKLIQQFVEDTWKDVMCPLPGTFFQDPAPVGPPVATPSSGSSESSPSVASSVDSSVSCRECCLGRGRGQGHGHVITFLEVYERSYCRTLETLVDIFQEYPDEVEYIFKPSCVPLMRCAGCCSDESLECVPKETHNVTMEIMKIKPHLSQHIGIMSFTEHSTCECSDSSLIEHPPDTTVIYI
ncbi:hypothetical protein EOD39_7117 [Acipenser ruthenus]|uniref:Platelet-derived growth factor (PDGF) family profile domain-containing protein n=1 Tax=Acipenser ruthenus TaxID=7906 RepID=A0A444U8D0_ACIRT|nr:hypothetical protein EOD39_7117 [Acipenser ruthenus]